jgi:hypothetical protein
MAHNFFADTKTDVAHLPIARREAWHREAWLEEQRELSALVGVRQFTSESLYPEVFEAIYDTPALWSN